MTNAVAGFPIEKDRFTFIEPTFADEGTAQLNASYIYITINIRYIIFNLY